MWPGGIAGLTIFPGVPSRARPVASGGVRQPWVGDFESFANFSLHAKTSLRPAQCHKPDDGMFSPSTGITTKLVRFAKQAINGPHF
jgi:hypothetical protein